jgi:hypothetical protein
MILNLDELELLNLLDGNVDVIRAQVDDALAVLRRDGLIRDTADDDAPSPAGAPTDASPAASPAADGAVPQSKRRRDEGDSPHRKEHGVESPVAETATATATAANMSAPRATPIRRSAVRITPVSRDALIARADPSLVGVGMPVPAIYASSHQQRQQSSQVQQGVRYADAAAAPLEPLTSVRIPAAVATVVGLPTGSELPLLPKKQAFRYDVLCFVTRGKYDFDTMDGFLSGDEAWRARAVRAAARVVVVKTPGSRPWLFLFDVGEKDALAPLGMRVQFTSTPQKEISIDALVADQLYVLQGPQKELERYATDVQLRTIIGKAGDMIYWEATGTPKTGWQGHILGAPLERLTLWQSAPQRASVKSKFDDKSTFDKRFARAGQMLHDNNKIQFALFNGFDVRVVMSEDITTEMKKTLAEVAWAKSVFTDVRARPVPPVVGGTPALFEFEGAAALCRDGEHPLFAAATRLVSETAWQVLQRQLFAGARALRVSPTAAVWAVGAGVAATLEGTVINGIIALSSSWHG